jgi:hypothetical protein
MIPIKHCRDLQIPLCESCSERIYNCCAVSIWRDSMPRHTIIDMINMYKLLEKRNINKIWFITSIEYYYPEMYNKFTKLLVLL